jgi:TetR/AcrR family transcriptional regulator, regulator of autoinduction and epiphytic fitness
MTEVPPRPGLRCRRPPLVAGRSVARRSDRAVAAEPSPRPDGGRTILTIWTYHVKYVAVNAQAVQALQVTPDTRKQQLLEAALTVFARHGYRKTSMDDVAQAAGVSRQGLYLHFETKEDLFRAAVLHAIHAAHAEVERALEAPEASLEDRLVAAFDAFVGCRVEAVGADVDDLMSACQTVLGPAVQAEKKAFAKRIAFAIDEAGLGAAHERKNVSSKDLALTLCATAYGLKQMQTTRQGFVAAMRTAVRAFGAS